MGSREYPRPSTHAKTPSSERRRSYRKAAHLVADVVLPGDLTIVGHTVDISADGIAIDVPYQLELGQECQIEMNLSRYGGPRWVQLTARVCRCVCSDEDQYRVGLEFTQMTSAVKDVLGRVCSP